MLEDSGPAQTLRHEFRELGKNLKELVQTAWKHDERRRLQNEIVEGLTELQIYLENLGHEIRASTAGEKIKAQTKQLSEAALAGEQELRAEQAFSNALRVINVEIQKRIDALSQTEEDQQ